MKKTLAILPLLTLLLLAGCGKSVSVVEYNDSFVEIFKECTDSTQELFNVYERVDNSEIDSIKEAVDNSISTCKNAEIKASKMWDFENDSSLKDAVVKVLSTEVDYLQKFWSTSNYRNSDDLTDADKVAYNSVVNELLVFEESLNNQFIALQDVQEAFATKHGLKLE